MNSLISDNLFMAFLKNKVDQTNFNNTFLLNLLSSCFTDFWNALSDSKSSVAANFLIMSISRSNARTTIGPW